MLLSFPICKLHNHLLTHCFCFSLLSLGEPCIDAAIHFPFALLLMSQAPLWISAPQPLKTGHFTARACMLVCLTSQSIWRGASLMGQVCSQRLLRLALQELTPHTGAALSLRLGFDVLCTARKRMLQGSHRHHCIMPLLLGGHSIICSLLSLWLIAGSGGGG